MEKTLQLNSQEEYWKASAFMFKYTQENNGSREVEEIKTIYSFPSQCEVLEFSKSKKFTIVGRDEKLINLLHKELRKFSQGQEIGEIVKKGFNIINRDSKLVEKLKK